MGNLKITYIFGLIITICLVASVTVQADPKFVEGTDLENTEMGGDLMGLFPNPVIRPGAVDSNKLNTTGVVPGTYENATITVGDDGRVSSASEGTPLENPFVAEVLVVNGPIDNDTSDAEIAPLEADYIRIKCEDADGCVIGNFPDADIGQTITLECDNSAFGGLNASCVLLNNPLGTGGAPVRINGLFLMRLNDTVSLMYVPRASFFGGGNHWVETSRIDYPDN